MPIIHLDNVSFSYDAEEKNLPPAIDRVSLSIEEGSFVALVGHNGSGKSTLAKLLDGLLLPSEGKVEIAGVDTSDESKIFEIRRNVGMVFQNPDNQMIASIVEDDIAFGPENLGLPREEIVCRVTWALEKVGMSEHRKGTPFKMSGGQKQRLAIAGVLAMKPRVLVFDESTAMLDPQGRAEVLKVARELNREENITVILITHYMDEAMDADRVVVMNRGKIVADGAPRDIFEQDRMLHEVQLAVPPLVQITKVLGRLGLDLPPHIGDREELVKALCPLL